jgi:ethanolamine ammonia-lyase small subunit
MTDAQRTRTQAKIDRRMCSCPVKNECNLFCLAIRQTRSIIDVNKSQNEAPMQSARRIAYRRPASNRESHYTTRSWKKIGRANLSEGFSSYAHLSKGKPER